MFFIEIVGALPIAVASAEQPLYVPKTRTPIIKIAAMCARKKVVVDFFIFSTVSFLLISCSERILFVLKFIFNLRLGYFSIELLRRQGA
ncbi:MAG: hypothetical protein UW03_C0012G0008 [Candidatus Peregrinibacteria bacterium GW2011_GWA2_43_8]|nr:MAG: hypothetical protein UW03_C0012G0008 [Candidatus Peregrinibacteria bacterium GW2011_GWA2_43_8]